MNSLDVRKALIETLRLDLVGPDNGHAFPQDDPSQPELPF